MQRAADALGFKGVLSDLGGPTANMYKMTCKSDAIERACRKLSCVHPGVCENLVTDHGPLLRLMRRVRQLTLPTTTTEGAHKFAPLMFFVEQLREDFDGFWISNPAGVIHLVIGDED